jgi:hypothetical protein
VALALLIAGVLLAAGGAVAFEEGTAPPSTHALQANAGTRVDDRDGQLTALSQVHPLDGTGGAEQAFVADVAIAESASESSSPPVETMPNADARPKPPPKLRGRARRAAQAPAPVVLGDNGAPILE